MIEKERGLECGRVSMATSLLGAKTAPTREIAEQMPSRLGKALIVRGLVETDGELHIHGNVEGRINADRLVLVGGSTFEGDIVARDVCIQGRMIGRIFARNVAVESSADIRGRIFHNTVSVAFGARVDGRMPWRPLNYFETLDQLPETRP
jgi:cytoskeletal protein CcmA (bactofilin family)